MVKYVAKKTTVMSESIFVKINKKLMSILKNCGNLHQTAESDPLWGDKFQGTCTSYIMNFYYIET